MDDLLLENKKYNIDRIFRFIISIIGFIGFFLLLHYLRDVLLPFTIAFVLAYLLDPIVQYIQRRVPNRLAAMSITLFGIVVIVGVAIAVFTPVVTSQMIRTAEVIGDVVMKNDVPQRLQMIIPESVWNDLQVTVRETDIQEVLRDGSVMKALQAVLQKVLPGVLGVFTGAATLISAFLSLTIVLLYLVFLLIDFDTSKKEWKELIPPAYKKPLLHFFDDFSDAMHLYFRGQALIAFITGILFAISFTIIGMPLGILLGLFLGLLNMVPYLQLVGLVPAFILGTVHAVDAGISIPVYLGIVVTVFCIVQIIQDAVLTPKIMGKSTGLSPAIILLAISVWGKLLGMLGLIIAIPMTCLCLASYKRAIAGTKKST